MRIELLPLMFIVIPALMAWAQEEKHVPVDREIGAEEVLRLVNPQYPGLEEFAEAMKSGDLKKAHELLVRHFATREKPVVPPAEFPGVGEGNSMVMLRARGDEQTRADDTWMRHIFTLSNNDIGKPETYDLGPNIDWLNTPSKALSWGLYLNQLNVLAQLAGVYIATREEKYAKEIGDLLLSWTKQVHRGYGYTSAGKYVNSGMEVRNRLCNCIAAYEIVRKSPSLTPEMHMAFWKTFIACSRELTTYTGVSYPGLMVAAVMLPEFTEAKQWMAAGEASLRNSLVERTTPDGAWDTHSISYQTVPVPWAARVQEFLKANPDSGDFGRTADMVREQTRKLLGIMLWIAMPNGGLPNIGDTYGRTDWNSAQAHGILKSYIHSQMTPEDKHRLEQIEDPFDRVKATLAIAEGTKGKEPVTTSIGFPATGYYVMRSDWRWRDAVYLYFDLSPQAQGHAHNDACHFELYACGKPLLVDAGDYFLGWGYRTALHNTIEVDEQQQARGAKAQMVPYEWITTDRFDFVDGAHTGYEEKGIIHRRKIIFVKPKYFILCDLLTGKGSHKYEQFFHFAGPTQAQPAEATLDEKSLGVATAHGETANVQVIPAYTDGLRASFVEAQETDMDIKDKYERKAMLGWLVTTGTFQRVKSPVAVYTREGDAPQCFYDVLFPVQRYAKADIRVESLPVSQDGKQLAPTQAACLVIHCRVTKPAHAPAEIEMKLGENLARGKTGFCEINETRFGEGAGKLLTNGDRGPRKIGEAAASNPYTPGVLLKGRFGVDLGEPVEVNTVVLHHGTWNGGAIIYPPEQMAVQYWDGQAWRDVGHPETAWQEEATSRTCFDTVKTGRLGVAVERKSGGRLAMREFEAYRVGDEERQRVEALLKETTTEEWTDTFLIGHEGPAMRKYGDVAFDGEVALLRKNAQGNAECVVNVRGTRLGEMDLARASDTAPLRITDVKVQKYPPQKGLAGAQPWADATWKTDRPATSQVEFGSDGKLDRRTPLDQRMTTDHHVRVEFLLADKEHMFRAVSVDEKGQRVEMQAR